MIDCAFRASPTGPTGPTGRVRFGPKMRLRPSLAGRRVRAVHRDANAAQICGTFASLQMLCDRADRPLAYPTGLPGSDPDSSRRELKQSNYRGGKPS
jgi:hypothetical protein